PQHRAQLSLLAPLSEYGKHLHPPTIGGKTLSEPLPVGGATTCFVRLTFGNESFGSSLMPSTRRRAGSPTIERVSDARSAPDLSDRANEIRFRHHPRDRQGVGVRDPADSASARRRGDRIAQLFAAPRSVAIGTKRTCQLRRAMSAFGANRTRRDGGNDANDPKRTSGLIQNNSGRPQGLAAHSAAR